MEMTVRVDHIFILMQDRTVNSSASLTPLDTTLYGGGRYKINFYGPWPEVVPVVDFFTI